MASPTTHKGNVGQAAAVLDALNRGYLVSIPLEGAPYDLIVDTGNRLLRVQVKYSCSSDGSLAVRFTTVPRYGGERNRYTSAEVDYIAACDGTTQKVYWIPIEATESDSMTLRLDPPKNGQKKGIFLAENYLSL